MKALLKFVLRYVEVLYLNPAYRIIDSRHRGIAEIDASISFSNGLMRWDVTNDRGQYDLVVSPAVDARQEDFFWISLIRQYLDGGDDRRGALDDLIGWLNANFTRIEQLFSDGPTAIRVCDELVALKKANAYKNWGMPKADS